MFARQFYVRGITRTRLGTQIRPFDINEANLRSLLTSRVSHVHGPPWQVCGRKAQDRSGTLERQRGGKDRLFAEPPDLWLLNGFCSLGSRRRLC